MTDVCRSHVLSLWYNRNTDAQGENQLTWTTVARVLANIGRKSIATSIHQHYGITQYIYKPDVIHYRYYNK